MGSLLAQPLALVSGLISLTAKRTLDALNQYRLSLDLIQPIRQQPQQGPAEHSCYHSSRQQLLLVHTRPRTKT